MRTLRPIATAAVVLLSSLLWAQPNADAGAVAPTVSIAGMAFTPKNVVVPLGASVTWGNNDEMNHTATSNQGFFDTGVIAPATASSPIVIRSAGKYAYHCAIHPSMTGSVRSDAVVVSGSPSEGFVIRWATQPAPEGVGYDVQYRRNGGSWQWWKRDTVRAKKLFNPTRNGEYDVRARTSNLVDAKESGWSVPLTVGIS